MRLSDVRGERIGICVSGGLSSLALAAWLADSGHDVVAIAADLGQCDRAEFDAFTANLRDAGLAVRELDLRAPMAVGALDVLAHLAAYDGGYWNTTGLSRRVIVEGVAPHLSEWGCTVLAHGCVGGGNDQRRFERYGARYLDGVPVFAAWADEETRTALPNRAAMTKLVEDAGLTCMRGNTVDYSTDVNLAGASHEGTGLEDLRRPASNLWRLLSVPPEQAPDAVATVVVDVAAGRPVALDQQRLEPAELFTTANAFAGGNGMGLVDVIESRVNGTKCRGVYEAPAMELLSHAVRAAYETVTDRAGSDLVRFLSRQRAVCVYEGNEFTVVDRAARAGLDELASFATASVQLDVYKGAVVGRAVLDLDPRAGVVQQRRFAGDGHNWASAPISPAPTSN